MEQGSIHSDPQHIIQEKEHIITVEGSSSWVFQKFEICFSNQAEILLPKESIYLLVQFLVYLS